MDETVLLLGLALVGLFVAAQSGVFSSIAPPAPQPSQSGAASTWYGDVTGNAPSADVSGDVDTLARTAYGEARGSGSRAMQGVCNVVMNRVRAGNFPGGRSVAGVCRAPNQFSAWNGNDPNRPVLLSVTSASPIFATALQLAQSAVAGTLPDVTGGALFYHDNSIDTPASWGQVQQTASIGGLEFYA